MDKIHFMYCPFTGLGLHNGFRGNRWLENRIRVFKQFVVSSLVRQTKREFILWISWRPEERDNKIVQEFEKSLNGIEGLTTIFTYGGLCFWDDKYEDATASAKLWHSLRTTLPELSSYVGNADRVYMTIQPSDDMYFNGAVEEIQKHTEPGAVGWKEGYLINYATKEIAEYNPDTTPPFFTIVFQRETFLDPQKHYAFTGPYKSHEYIGDHMKYTPLTHRRFVVGTHGENISTTFNHPYKGRVLLGQEAEDVLIRTGTLFADPVVIRQGMKLFARKVLNVLPFQDTIRNYYHKLPSVLKVF
jgi:hypothetical protein